MIELTLVMKKKISKKDFEKLMKDEIFIKFDKNVHWNDDLVAADTGNFDGIVLDFSGGEMLFVSNDHPWVAQLLEEDDIASVHIHFPELD